MPIIPWNFFRSGYSGKPLHIIRNSKTVSIDTFISVHPSRFPTGATDIKVKYTTPQFTTGIPPSSAFENITFLTTSADIPTANLIAAPFTSSGHRLNSVVIRIDVSCMHEDEEKQSAMAIIVHVHDTISRIWTGPERFTIRPGHERYSPKVFVRFDDGIMAELTAYDTVSWTDFTWAITNSTLDTFLSVLNGKFIVDGTLPGTPAEFDDGISLTLNTGHPLYSSASGAVNSGTGSISFQNSAGTVTPIMGNIDKTSSNSNFLILGDGFLASEEELFNHFACQIVTHLNYSPRTSPWNLFDDKINYWSYFLPSRQSGGAHENEYVVLQRTGTNVVAMSVEFYMFICEEITARARRGDSVDQIRLWLTSSKNATVLDSLIDWTLLGTVTMYHGNITTLLSYVGYPVATDTGKNLATKTVEWRQIGGTTSSTAPFRIPGDPPPSPITPDPRWLIEEFVYSLWQRLHDRIFFTPPDTIWGVYRRNDKWDGDTLEISNRRFETKNRFNRAIANVKYYRTPTDTNPILLGARFFQSNGNITAGGDADNIVILSKIQSHEIKGLTVPYTVDGVSRVISVYNEDYSEVQGFLAITPDIYKPQNIPISQMGFNALNATVHELNHPVLSDEYAQNVGAFLPDDIEKEYIKKVNLQLASDITPFSLLNINKVKWLWPRIVKIGITSTNLGAGPLYAVTLGDIYPQAQLPLEPMAFHVGDRVLLRKRKLYETDHQQFIITNISGNQLTMSYQGTGNIDITDYPAGSILVFPRWNSNVLGDYQKLIYPDVLNWMGTNGALAEESTDPSGFHNPQMPDPTVISGFDRPRNRMKIVGLYGAGYGYSSGIYHATGFCMMRSSFSNQPRETPPQSYDPITDLTAFPAPYTANSFCPVCKYILVDLYNPLAHPIIDNEYEYPQP